MYELGVVKIEARRARTLNFLPGNQEPEEDETLTTQRRQ
jgi:hypothetical protein